ncbi:MAG: hypothetical protein JNL58_15310 [Planctomyces sp.]|nr:hypothetical protein [Planctomyces sp.]
MKVGTLGTLLNSAWFPSAMAVIVGISVYDTWLIIRFARCIVELEENPIGSWLLEINNGDISLFVGSKIVGTILVASILLLMKRLNSRIVFPVTTSIASWQVGLLFYLTHA